MKGISLKINRYDNMTKLISIIKKVNGKSISQIRSDIENKENILESERYILEELELILSTSQKLTEVGAEVEIYRGDMLINIESLKNVIQSNKIIAKQSQDIIDEEIGEGEKQ